MPLPDPETREMPNPDPETPETLAPDPETPEMLAPDPETQDAHDSDLQAKEFDVPNLQSIDPGSKFTGYPLQHPTRFFSGLPPGTMHYLFSAKSAR